MILSSVTRMVASQNSLGFLGITLRVSPNRARESFSIRTTRLCSALTNLREELLGPMFSSGDLVKVFAPGHGFIDNAGFAVFIREVIPSRDLAPNHDFWKSMKGPVLGGSRHYEVLYGGQLFLLHDKQFILVALDDHTLMNDLQNAQSS